MLAAKGRTEKGDFWTLYTSRTWNCTTTDIRCKQNNEDLKT